MTNTRAKYVCNIVRGLVAQDIPDDELVELLKEVLCEKDTLFIGRENPHFVAHQTEQTAEMYFQ